MKIGLFFGSFNPVHVGHMIIADFMAENTDMDEVWMVVSPQNPLKKKTNLAKDYDRLHLVNLAIGEHSKIRSSNIEFDLPKPSYTINTLTYLKEKYPEKEFCLIMGGDNLGTIHKWKNYEVLLKDYEIYVYSRPQYDMGEYTKLPNIHIAEAPLLDISASYIRKSIKEGRSIRYMLTSEVFQYINGSNLFKD